jgi:hypothetical protein
MGCSNEKRRVKIAKQDTRSRPLVGISSIPLDVEHEHELVARVAFTIHDASNNGFTLPFEWRRIFQNGQYIWRKQDTDVNKTKHK